MRQPIKKAVPQQTAPPIKTKAFKIETLPEEKWLKCTTCKGTGFIKNIGDNGTAKGQMACPVYCCTEGTIDRIMVQVESKENVNEKIKSVDF